MHLIAITAQVASWGERSLGGGWGMGGGRVAGGGGFERAVQAGHGVTFTCTPCTLIVQDPP